jgi:hypothetical protein
VDGALVGAGSLWPLHLPLKATITQGSIQNSKVVIPKSCNFYYTSPQGFANLSHYLQDIQTKDGKKQKE